MGKRQRSRRRESGLRKLPSESKLQFQLRLRADLAAQFRRQDEVLKAKVNDIIGVHE